MKSKIIKVIVVFVLIVLSIIFYILYTKNNLRFISDSDKKYIMNILEITDAESFKPISKNFVNTGFGSSAKYYEIKFEISKNDYLNNNLNYYEESYYDILVDCRYKEEINNDVYLCIIRVSDVGNNKELYEKIRNFR